MEDPCLKCENVDERKRLLEENYLHAAGLRDPDDPPLPEDFLKYKHLFEVAPDAIFIAKVESGVILDANQSAADLLGIPVEEIIGMHQAKLHPPEEAERYKKLFRKHIKQESGAFLDDMYVCHKDGHKIPVQINTTVTHISSTKIIYGIFRDITEQKTLEKNLQQSERKYKALYDEAPVALFRTGLDGMLLNCNKACLLFFGLSQDEPEENYLNRINVGEHYVDPERRGAFIKALTQNKRVKHFQAELRKPDGSTFWASISAEVFPEAGYIEGAMYDITVKKCLTKTEHLVLEILLKGKSNKEIARHLRRSVRTIEDHRARIMHKLGVDNLVDLARKVLTLNNYHTEK